MDFRYYKPTELESWISQKYQDNGIHYAADMDIDYIASIFNITVKTTKGESKAIWDDDYCLILLSDYLTEEQKREHFFHELCHPLKHVGNQHNMPQDFLELQENQAAHFQLYAAMPAYLLREFKGISSLSIYTKVLSEEFKLPIPFVERRIDQVKRRIFQGRMDHQLSMNRQSVWVRHEYSQETKLIMNKLKFLQAKKGVH